MNSTMSTKSLPSLAIVKPTYPVGRNIAPAVLTIGETGRTGAGACLLSGQDRKTCARCEYFAF
jgi:hypothetical protein